MFRIPCPYCGALLRTRRGAPGKKGKCPSCKWTVHLLAVDNTNFQALFPFVKWCPAAGDRCSPEHAALARNGIDGGPYFQRDDPLLAPWWVARRKGLPQCGCDFVPISKWEASKLHLRPGWVAPLPFDPWNPRTACATRDEETAITLER